MCLGDRPIGLRYFRKVSESCSVGNTSLQCKHGMKSYTYELKTLPEFAKNARHKRFINTTTYTNFRFVQCSCWDCKVCMLPKRPGSADTNEMSNLNSCSESEILSYSIVSWCCAAVQLGDYPVVQRTILKLDLSPRPLNLQCSRISPVMRPISCQPYLIAVHLWHAQSFSNHKDSSFLSHYVSSFSSEFSWRLLPVCVPSTKISCSLSVLAPSVTSKCWQILREEHARNNQFNSTLLPFILWLSAVNSHKEILL